MNVAADMLINDMLRNAKVGTMPPDALHDLSLVNENMNLFDAYRKVFKDAERQGKRRGKVRAKRARATVPSSHLPRAAART